MYDFLLSNPVAPLRTTLGKAGRFLFSPLAIPMYKMTWDKCSDHVLYFANISNLTYRPTFYTLQRIINSIDNFQGEIVECGVYKGHTLLGMAHLLKKRNIDVNIYGLDSFEGFPEPSHQDAVKGEFNEKTQKGFFGDTSELILQKQIQRLGFENQVILIKGFFKDSLPQLKNHPISVLHLDVDLYDSYRICLESLYDNVVPGGYIIFDEYSPSTATYPGSKKAIDEFFKDKPERIEFFDDADSRRIPHTPRRFIRKKSY